jgi:hypothetical protein
MVGTQRSPRGTNGDLGNEREMLIILQERMGTISNETAQFNNCANRHILMQHCNSSDDYSRLYARIWKFYPKVLYSGQRVESSHDGEHNQRAHTSEYSRGALSDEPDPLWIGFCCSL